MPQSLPLTPIALGAATLVALLLLQRIPYVGAVIRAGISLGLIAIAALVLTQRAAFDPFLAGLADRFNLDRQQVVGGEVRIPMAANGHFVATADLGDGVRRRMMVDSGATLTALSAATAEEAGLEADRNPLPVVLQTANGAVPARTATVPELRLGAIVARNLKVVVSPAFGDMDVLGMNFLSKLASWRVEGRTLILVPHHPQPATPGAA